MKKANTMTDKQLWGWMEKSIHTCQNIYDKAASYETACGYASFQNARDRFNDCAEEFDKRGLKTKNFSVYEYNETYMSDYFTDSMA